ncbi:rhodanese-like domain-containing protein [Malacoplasma iowae]|uniref:Rhodanese-like domain-containing protein n=1 Tax=Malacoplasma iowae 695 TaxID=1048830 RepID=A0A6P1LNI7_MALIO|nr:rhodanese-like domain-containing protein [Malacoplasma iowae]VEU61881.1 tRNA s(4)U8 sulfurtransferase [Mycoplasmopsis fermentans]EGZ31066.1 Rhodanese domain-containing protein [Malacoplasma iowae 695]QHG90082.1 rhodanese-like domain-containing protein [Malacoplasma iowae 695]WPL36184.1 rhodanese-like domain-containing protein [Malacoplasma iowae]WPL38536.1 rhodanese-like domain-containing protein [Malacoplasma iowae]
MKNITWKSVLEKQNKDNVIVDIRDKETFDQLKINNDVINLNKDMIDNNQINLDKSKKYYIYCNRGMKSKEITEKLSKMGYDTSNIEGGYQEYIKNKK